VSTLKIAAIHSGEDMSLVRAGMEAAFASLGLPIEVTVIDVSATDFDSTIRQLAETGYRGAWVGNPHKPLAAKMGEKFFLARNSVGVANSLLFGEHIYAQNSEVLGLVMALEGIEPGKALVLGAGQAARAVVMALIECGWQVRLWNRNATKSRVLQTLFKRYQDIELASQPDPATCRLVVNATPIGLKIGEKAPVMTNHLIPKSVVCDMVIRRAATELCRDASMRGLRTISGKRLLANQIFLSVEWWTSQKPDLEAIRLAMGDR
jgi:shikimate dehydrogenase